MGDAHMPPHSSILRELKLAGAGVFCTFLPPSHHRTGKGILNLAHQRAFARTPWLSPVPLATYSHLRAAGWRVRVLDGVPPAPALARPGAAPSLLSRFAGRGPGGSLSVLHACEGRRTRLRVPGASRQTVLGTPL